MYVPSCLTLGDFPNYSRPQSAVCVLIIGVLFDNLTNNCALYLYISLSWLSGYQILTESQVLNDNEYYLVQESYTVTYKEYDARVTLQHTLEMEVAGTNLNLRRCNTTLSLIELLNLQECSFVL